MATELIPVRFYGLDTLIYFINAVIALAIAYKAYKLYDYSSKKQHFYLASAFALLGIALSTLTLTTAFTYYAMLIAKTGIYFFDPIFNIDDLGFWIYHFTTLIAYCLLALMYLPHREGFVPGLFFSARYYEYFNVVLFFVIAYVAFRATINYSMRRTKTAFLVMCAFLMIAASHAILPFAAFSKLAYVIGHGAHLAGFGSLLIMLFLTGRR